MPGPTGIGLMNLAGLTMATLVELREFFVGTGTENPDARADADAWIRAIDAELDLRGAP